MAVTLGAIAASIAILTAIVRGLYWIYRKFRVRRPQQAAPQPAYPVRLTCREANDFHPAAVTTKVCTSRSSTNQSAL
jgi:hypothetical protein